jgi:uncharacterized membrane protein YcaP (DUF421 family)
MDWHGFWFGTGSLPWYMVALRTTLIYLTITLCTRLLHFRHVGMLSQHNYLVAAGVVGIAGSRIISPEASLLVGLLAIIFLTTLGLLLSYLDLKIPKFIRPEPITLIENGQIHKKNLLKSYMTIENLLGQLRLKGVFDLSTVEYVYLEGTGKISVVKKLVAKPVFRQQFNLPEKLACPPAHLIYNGQILEQNLTRLALDKKWLERALHQQGFATPEQVFLATLLPDGTLYISSN